MSSPDVAALTALENIQSYHRLLGNFWQSFNNLEFFLRLYLFRRKGDGRLAMSYLTADIGAYCEENAITDYRSFSELCDAFNREQTAERQIDFREIKALRDALAHGRVVADEQASMTVVRFSRPNKKTSKVKVEYRLRLDQATLQHWTVQTADLGVEISRRMGAPNAPPPTGPAAYPGPD